MKNLLKALLILANLSPVDKKGLAARMAHLQNKGLRQLHRSKGICLMGGGLHFSRMYLCLRNSNSSHILWFITLFTYLLPSGFLLLTVKITVANYWY